MKLFSQVNYSVLSTIFQGITGGQFLMHRSEGLNNKEQWVITTWGKSGTEATAVKVQQVPGTWEEGQGQVFYMPGAR